MFGFLIIDLWSSFFKVSSEFCDFIFLIPHYFFFPWAGYSSTHAGFVIAFVSVLSFLSPSITQPLSLSRYAPHVNKSNTLARPGNFHMKFLQPSWSQPISIKAHLRFNCKHTSLLLIAFGSALSITPTLWATLKLASLSYSQADHSPSPWIFPIMSLSWCFPHSSLQLNQFSLIGSGLDQSWIPHH